MRRLSTLKNSTKITAGLLAMFALAGEPRLMLKRLGV